MTSPTGLEQRLGYTFQDAALLRQALTHRSHSNLHNERLEFLGDAVLNLVAAQVLYERHPHWDEGELSRVRSLLVNREALFRMAQFLDLAPVIRLGSGELQGGGRQRSSILADTMEAVFGALYQDGGLTVAIPLIIRLLEQAGLDSAALQQGGNKDGKTRLQEWLQARHHPLPVYELLAREGVDHAPHFRVRCQMQGKEALGEGRSRRDAEQQAALNILQQLET
ncbi:ribonuclease III [Ferrovum myxofaciens]|uniref:Ribonuclease 3 n=2 Tax=root TaxID=1 RepID=A0A859ABY1_9PROT|nr:ribonuclease III [Ferrovum myxofaciens]KXW58946.1 ribonuclease 3 [Ferrovum myxofaciens]MBU6993886.1 ribonuclease III [Ferrovum myxofaciens]QKE39672.2 MAG: ribonuclease III [Ferrovum myxofaciens]QWY75399.1 MAG: ribonuclease III [Ferrovum myxofaciens]QWY78139.1 MAG: ribonuclease III [Ferrovum myxofaciens]